MQIEVTKEEAKILSDILLEEMQKIGELKFNKFVDKELLEKYTEQVKNIFSQATDIGFSVFLYLACSFDILSL